MRIRPNVVRTVHGQGNLSLMWHYANSAFSYDGGHLWCACLLTGSLWLGWSHRDQHLLVGEVNAFSVVEQFVFGEFVPFGAHQWHRVFTLEVG